MERQLFNDIRVEELSAVDRAALERLFDKPVSKGQRVFISGYFPSRLPTPGNKRSAKQIINAILEKAHGNACDRGVTDSDMESAISEAVNDAKRRR